MSWWKAVSAVVVVVALVLCGIGITAWLLFAGGSAQTATQPQVTSNPVTTVADPDDDDDEEEVVVGCNELRAGASAAALSEAPETNWELWRGIPIPSSVEHGPFEISENDDVASCFSRTPAGALFAANNLSIRTLVPTDEAASIRAMTLPGPGQDRLLKAHEDIDFPAYAEPGELCRDSGFAVVLYTEDEAAIEFSASCSDSLMQVTVLKVVWVDGDWKLRLADDGGAGHSQRQIFSMDGLIVWEPSA